MSALKVVGGFILAVLFICLLDFTGLFWESKIGVYREDVRRNVYEHTKSYNQGKIQDLAKDFHEYNQADEQGKIAIKALVRQQFSDFDSNMVNDSQLRMFLEQCRL